MKKLMHRSFLIILIIVSIIAVFFLFRPFLVEMIIAAVLVSVFYAWYDKLARLLWNKKYLASFIMCILLLLIIIIPISNLIVYAGKKSVSAYNGISEILNKADIIQYSFLEKMNIDIENQEPIKNLIVDTTKKISDWLLSGATSIVKSTTDFVVSLLIIILTMFFFFVDGKNMAKKLILWSPLPNKYDIEIIKKFRQVSYSSLFSVFVTAIVQGLLGGLGFFIIGWPFIFTFIVMAFLSLIPYIGSSIFYVPVAIYLFINGQFLQAIFIILWCALVVSNIDEVIRAYIIKGKSEVYMIFIIFSILGGISIFGFWGVIIGPLIVALTATILHIYEIEYNTSLEK